MEKGNAFKHPRNSIGHTFNITSEESITTTDFDKSAVWVRSLFKQKKNVDDAFEVSYNVTPKSLSQSETLITITENNTSYNKSETGENFEITKHVNKSNPFRKITNNKAREIHNALQVSFMEEEDGNKLTGNTRDALKKSYNKFSIDNSLLESNNVSTSSEVIFNQSLKKHKLGESHSALQVSFTEEVDGNKSTGISRDASEKSFNKSSSIKSFKCSDVRKSSEVNFNNSSFKQTKKNKTEESHNALQASFTEEEDVDKSTGILRDELHKSDKSVKKFSIDKSLLKCSDISTSSETNFNQSSFNDLNLNGWMSDNSDEEILSLSTPAVITSEAQVPPPSAPPVTTSDEEMPPQSITPTATSDEEIPQKRISCVLSSDEKVLSMSIPPVTATDEEVPQRNVLPVVTSDEEILLSTNRMKKNSSLIEEKTQKLDETMESKKPGEKLTWQEKFEEIVCNSKKVKQVFHEKPSDIAKPNKKPVKKPLAEVKKYKPPKLNKPAQFVTKKLYQYIINKLESKYGIDTLIKAEQLVLSICDTVKIVTRRKAYQKKLVQDLKKEMAKAGVIETTVDFYEFVIKFLPYSFRVKVVPCVQPVTNTVFPPKDVVNPFEKIL